MYTGPMPRGRITAAAIALGVLGTAPPASAAPTDEQARDLLIELHYKPIANLQIAVWLEDRAGA